MNLPDTLRPKPRWLLYGAAFCGFMAVASCTAGTMGKFKALGSSAHIRCYSGGVLIYEGNSTGKVTSERSSDGYYFIDAADDKLKEVSGNCVIEYGK